jgi:hypothetical protein
MNIITENDIYVLVANIPKNELKKSYDLAGFDEIACL